MADILTTIVEKRKADIEKLGLTFGFDIPAKRKRSVHPFLVKKGVILEIKRASPSKGDIAPGLDSAATAISYAKAGANAISCLTETNYFKGTLEDLMRVCNVLDTICDKPPAVLRKDFLLSPDEVEVSYRAGADAILLIARILETSVIVEMAKKAASYKMTSLVEIRTEEDLKKLAAVTKAVDKNFIVCGVNSRDLANFKIDLLTPCRLLKKIHEIAGKNARVIFESGIRTPEAAGFAGSLGFNGMLLGEAAAKAPELRKALVESFMNAESSKNADFWKEIAENLGRNNNRPLLKICGINQIEDGLKAEQSAADFLGFIFYKKSPRNTREKLVRDLRTALYNKYPKAPKFVGVIVNPEDEEAKLAIRLTKEGILDVLQLHTADCAIRFLSNIKNRMLPHYCAVNLKDERELKQVDELFKLGEPRVLIDAQSTGENGIGGTGKRIDDALVKSLLAKHQLWLAGGISTENVKEILDLYNPELIDVSSSLESKPGKKDLKKLEAFASALGISNQE